MRTGKLLVIHMEKEKTNMDYAKLLRDLFLDHGDTIEIRIDRRTSFLNKDNDKTNLNFCLKNLKTNSKSTSKSNVERLFKSAQNIYPFAFANQKSII